MAAWKMGRRGSSRLWPRLTLLQVLSHLATFYSLGSFAAVIQPVWLTSKSRTELAIVASFWAVFAVSLLCYCLTCFGDIKFHEERCPISNGFEARSCDDCGSRVTRRRVKHCQTCDWCILDFDHHCRYLNVCIGGGTYKQWFCFVVGLAILMATCAAAAIDALRFPERFDLADKNLAAFYSVAGLQAALSTAELIFLLCLMAQHVFFIYEGITTLEYIKDQGPGFPSLPPAGWREAARHDQCYVCREYLEHMLPTDPSEVWFCSICQGDLAKASVEFLSCGNCDNINICMLCQRLAQNPSAPVVSYRVSAMKKRCEVEARMRGPSFHAYTPSHDGSEGSLKQFLPGGSSRVSSLSGRNEKEPRTKRRSITALVAAIEGDGGDGRKASWCRCACGQGAENDQGCEVESEGSGSGSDI